MAQTFNGREMAAFLSSCLDFRVFKGTQTHLSTADVSDGDVVLDQDRGRT